MNKKTGAFTLVELIVVITILAVLATVAFISFQGYTSSSRDSVRLADLKNITKSFELLKTRDQQLPLPDQSINITATGVTFQYQGVLEESTLKKNGIHNGGLDPQTKEPYGYVVNLARNKFQVIGFLENYSVATNNIFTQSLADNTDKYIKTSGDVLGILLDTTTNEVITTDGGVTDIDVVQTTSSYNLVLEDQVEQGNNTLLKKVHTINNFGIHSTCKKLLEAQPSLSGKDGFYTISPNGGKVLEVYCDMTNDNGGWTVKLHQYYPTLTNPINLGNINSYDELISTCNQYGLKVFADYETSKNNFWNVALDYLENHTTYHAVENQDYTGLALGLQYTGSKWVNMEGGDISLIPNISGDYMTDNLQLAGLRGMQDNGGKAPEDWSFGSTTEAVMCGGRY